MTHTGLLALALLATAAIPASAEVAFDGFLAGFDDACRRTPAFDAFQEALVAAFVPPAEAKGRVSPPAEIAGAVGAIKATDKSDHVEVRVSVTGTFAGLKLARMVFDFGKENGIYAYALEFAEPTAVVKKRFAAAVERGAKKMAAADETDSGASTGFDFTKGRAALYCDFSN